MQGRARMKGMKKEKKGRVGETVCAYLSTTYMRKQLMRMEA
jgi:hypothetical protein